MSKRQCLRRVRLYALLSEKHCRLPWRETAERLLAGGADVLQLREKELDDDRLLARARLLRRLTEEHSALLIVNDRPDVAMLCGADGVHLGQDDLPVEEVRKLMGPRAVIGLSTHTPEQAEEAEGRGADYIGVGPVFPTQTKGYDRGGGLQLAARICAATRLPTVAIGGITPANARTVVEAGAQAVGACAALCGAEDPEQAAREFLHALRKEKAERG